MHGVLLLNKPEGISSAHAVAKIKRILKLSKSSKVGHGGTLDPFACGVLPILIGNGCKLSDYILGKDKAYIFTIKFGQHRQGLDSTGEVLLEDKNFNISEADLKQAILHFKGGYMQIPPLFSALKHNGQRLYKLAREGKAEDIDLESKKRQVFIKDMYLRDFNEKEGKATVYALVSKGTYIRSLAFDIASYLNTLGYVDYLQRVLVGGFSLSQCIDLNDLQNMAIYDISNKLLSMNNVLDDIPVLHLESDIAKKLCNGLIAYNFPLPLANGIFRAVYENKVIALMENSVEKGFRILKVFNY